MFNDNNTKDKDTTEVSEKEKKETSDKDQPKSDSGWGTFDVWEKSMDDAIGGWGDEWK